MNIKCDFCGKEFDKPLSEIKRTKHNFCSPRCWYNYASTANREKNNPSWKGGKKKVLCDWCGKELYRKKSAVYSHNFCSRECWYKWFPKNIRGKNHHAWKPKMETECDWCGEKIKCFPSKINFQRHFCSNSCRTKWLSEFLSKEPLVLKCLWCGKRFERDKGHTIKYNNHFCSSKCRNKWNARNMPRCTPPTAPEKRIMNVVKDYKLPFIYVGDGKGKTTVGKLTPDFIGNNGKRQIIEVFGRYWHDPSFKEEVDRRICWERTEQGRKAYFTQFGYETLILWDDQIKEMSDEDIVRKIQDFTS